MAAAPITSAVAQAGGSVNTTLAISAGLDTLASGGAAALLGQNPQAAVTAAANEYMNNCAAGDDACKRLAEQGALNPMSGTALAPACGDGSQPCNTQVLQAMMEARGANADQALSNMRTMALYGGPLAGVAMIGPEALTAAGLAGAYDYAGDVYSYATGLSKDAPNFTKSYVTGIVGGLTYPFAIGDGAIASMGTAGKIAANGYNALVAGTGAFGAAAMTHQDNPDLSGGFGAGAAGLGGLVKSLFPRSLGNFLNNMIQGGAGPLQNAVTQNGSGK